MSKLFKLKEWLTVPDAAKHLSIAFGEVVSEADVLRLALDKRLKLSVNFVNGTTAEGGKVVPLMEALMLIMPIDRSNSRIEEIMPRYLNKVHITDELPVEDKKGLLDKTLCFVPAGIEVGENKILQIERGNIHTLRGVFDLAMVGAEHLDIEHKYQILTDGVEVTDVAMEGAFVISPDGEWFKLLTHYDENPYSNSDEQKKERAKKKWNDPDNYYPAGGLPVDTVLVVRTDALRKFEETINDTPTNMNKPLTTSERDSLLKLVIGMAMKGYSYDPNAKKNSAVADIAADLALLGLPLGDDTIRKYLKQGNEQLPAKPTNT
ncbi:MAG: hypothetical protein ACYDDT_00710 [Sulfuricella sp.]